MYGSVWRFVDRIIKFSWSSLSHKLVNVIYLWSNWISFPVTSKTNKSCLWFEEQNRVCHFASRAATCTASDFRQRLTQWLKSVNNKRGQQSGSGTLQSMDMKLISLFMWHLLAGKSIASLSISLDEVDFDIYLTWLNCQDAILVTLSLSSNSSDMWWEERETSLSSHPSLLPLRLFITREMIVRSTLD
jgi:hypothetical protein